MSRVSKRAFVLAFNATWRFKTFFIKEISCYIAAALRHVKCFLLLRLLPISSVARNVQACIIITAKLLFLAHSSSHNFVCLKVVKNLNHRSTCTSSHVRVESVNCFDGTGYVIGCKSKLFSFCWKQIWFNFYYLRAFKISSRTSENNAHTKTTKLSSSNKTKNSSSFWGES